MTTQTDQALDRPTPSSQRTLLNLLERLGGSSAGNGWRTLFFAVVFVAGGLFVFAIGQLQKASAQLADLGNDAGVNTFFAAITLMTLVIILAVYAALMAVRTTVVNPTNDTTASSQTSSQTSSHEALVKQCKELGHVPHDSIHQIASVLSQMSVQYYQDVRQQAQRSFFSALGAAVVGLIVFIYALIIAMTSDNDIGVYISALAGGLIEVISAVNFYLYFRTARQFAAFHTCLERTNRFLMANAMCEHLGERKDEMRAELIRELAKAPLLTLRLLENGE